MNDPRCESLDDYLAGELPADHRSAFEIHLGGCEPCRDAVEDWQALRRVLQTATSQLESPSAALRERIESAATARPAPHVRDAQTWRIAALLGASLVAVALFAVMLRPAPRLREIVKAPKSNPKSNPKAATAPIERAPIATASVKTLSLPANIEFPDDVIGVPIDIGDPHITVVWLYPTTPAANPTN